MNDQYTSAELASKYNVNVRTARRWLSSGDWRSYRPGNELPAQPAEKNPQRREPTEPEKFRDELTAFIERGRALFKAGENMNLAKSAGTLSKFNPDAVREVLKTDARVRAFESALATRHEMQNCLFQMLKLNAEIDVALQLTEFIKARNAKD